MLGWLAADTIFGARIHIAQSSVGKVFASCAILPPIDSSLSTR
ncbi:hypothetical protein GYY_09355 [Methanococcus maripaludis X1]|uniref:Uncharacterized protein n=1 Tax=Methanococcus maripaludis X1 TaxID=1053692 RepID=G0H457_METMI|nr:hypothetical protein GYY_09355 [Methanococcus maripaludis X1]